MHNKGSFNPNDIAQSAPLKLLEASFESISKAITLADGELTATMKHKLSKDIFVFSGFKTMHTLKEASLLLSDEKGEIKPFNTFLNDVRKIDNTYNKNYLRAEYDFAVSSVTMASKWDSFSDDDRYNLQYRTAGDDNVRSSHRTMHNVTLSKSDSFWTKYYPPNGWGCRCTVMEVLKEDYETTDSDNANEMGSESLVSIGKDGERKKNKMFEFNSGAEACVFPKNHPYYTCRQMGSCDKVSLTAKFGKNALCKGCLILDGVQKEQTRQKLKQTDREVKRWVEKSLNGSRIIVKSSEFIESKKIAIANPITKRFLAHAKSMDAKEMLYNMDSLKFELVDSLELGAIKDMNNVDDKNNVLKKKARGVVKYNYYKAKYKNNVVFVDFEVHRDGYEQPYSIRIKKP